MKIKTRELREIRELIFWLWEFLFVMFALLSILWAISIIMIFIAGVINEEIAWILLRGSIFVFLFCLLNYKIVK